MRTTHALHRVLGDFLTEDKDAQPALGDIGELERWHLDECLKEGRAPDPRLRRAAQELIEFYEERAKRIAMWVPVVIPFWTAAAVVSRQLADDMTWGRAFLWSGMGAGLVALMLLVVSAALYDSTLRMEQGFGQHFDEEVPSRPVGRSLLTIGLVLGRGCVALWAAVLTMWPINFVFSLIVGVLQIELADPIWLILWVMTVLALTVAYFRFLSRQTPHLVRPDSTHRR